jgi:hypothetical protein
MKRVQRVFEDEALEKLVEEMPSPNPVLPEQIPTPFDIFQSLSIEEQDEVLRMIIGQDGFGRIAKLVQSNDTPGAMDLFLDRVRYYHFLPMVKD